MRMLSLLVVVFLGCTPKDPDGEAPLVAQFGDPASFELTVIGDADALLDAPQDLDFNPERPGELWVVNRANDDVVIFFDAGTDDQTSEQRKDVYGNHFMEEVSGIAFGAEGTFATSQDTRNTYDDMYQYNDFMGPALWPSDLDIFATANQNNQLLGSHLDMLHESPWSMGIAHEVDNVYWVFDGLNSDLVRYDFGIDHGPGHDDHSDGIVRRYSEVELSRTAGVPGGMILDSEDSMLYIADTGAGRILRVDITTGEVAGPLTQLMEPLAEYSAMEGVEFEELTSGFDSPTGIALTAEHVFVTERESGDIIALNREGEEVDRISTDAAAIAGLVVGPDEQLWYVDAENDEVVRVEPGE